jgi:MtN3 and saliva related transmembrane protein
MIDLFIWLGRLAGLIMCGSYIPQQWKIYKNKSSEGVSLEMFILVVCALIIYQVYSFLVKEPVFLFTNSVGLVLALNTLRLIIKYRKTGERKC